MLFDGVCNLCTAAVQFMIKHDPNATLKYASLQSDYAQRLLRHYSVSIRLDGRDDTVAFIENGKVYTHSDAGLRIAGYLNGPIRLATGLRIVPLFIRDAVYRLIARSRYRIFGKQTACWIPTAALESRFLG